MITENRNVAIAYDFDGTLAPGNMQEYNFIPDLNMDKGEFWQEANEMAQKHDMDEVLAYMHLMLIKAKEQNLDIRESTFEKYGEKSPFSRGWKPISTVSMPTPPNKTSIWNISSSLLGCVKL